MEMEVRRELGREVEENVTVGKCGLKGKGKWDWVVEMGNDWVKWYFLKLAVKYYSTVWSGTTLRIF